MCALGERDKKYILLVKIFILFRHERFLLRYFRLCYRRVIIKLSIASDIEVSQLLETAFLLDFFFQVFPFDLLIKFISQVVRSSASPLCQKLTHKKKMKLKSFHMIFFVKFEGKLCRSAVFGFHGDKKVCCTLYKNM